MNVGKVLVIINSTKKVGRGFVFGLNIFNFISHEKDWAEPRCCHSSLPHNDYTCIEVIIFSHNTYTHTHVHMSPKSYQVMFLLPCICVSVCNQDSSKRWK